MPTCKRLLQRGVNKRKMEGGGALIQADKYMKVCVCVHGCLSVWHCLLVCVCLPQEDSLLRDRWGGGLLGWICQKPGAVLCTIRIKVSISGCYLLRDVLYSPFWWPRRPNPLKTEMACTTETKMGPRLSKRTLFNFVLWQDWAQHNTTYICLMFFCLC